MQIIFIKMTFQYTKTLVFIFVCVFDLFLNKCVCVCIIVYVLEKHRHTHEQLKWHLLIRPKYWKSSLLLAVFGFSICRVVCVTTTIQNVCFFIIKKFGFSLCGFNMKCFTNKFPKLIFDFVLNSFCWLREGITISRNRHLIGHVFCLSIVTN